MLQLQHTAPHTNHLSGPFTLMAVQCAPVRCACPCLVVPLSDASLQVAVRAADLALAAEEEEELASGSESDSDEEMELDNNETGKRGCRSRLSGTAPRAYMLIQSKAVYLCVPGACLLLIILCCTVKWQGVKL